MVLEYSESIVELLANLSAVSICLFQYIHSKNKALVYTIAVFLCGLLSNYYWSAYLLIMGDSPNVYDIFYYLGWNVAYLLLLFLILHMKDKEEKRYFHPVMLIPIPLNLYQLALYLPFGGELNSIYQVTVMTAVACLCLQSICWYVKNREKGAKKPYYAISLLLMAFFLFGMWTSSCFDEPVRNLYYLFSIMNSLNYFFLVWAVSYSFRDDARDDRDRIGYHTALKGVYMIVVIFCSIGGLVLGGWMRDMMNQGLRNSYERLYDIITVILFIISLFLSAFVVAIIIAVNLAEKMTENEEFLEARIIAERSNEAKSEFLANMSHEIRTPINAILGMNEIVLRESIETESVLPRDRETIRAVFGNIRTYAGNIDSAGKNLLSIINDILDFSKIEAGKLKIVNAEYQLSSVLNDVSNIIVFKAGSKDLEFNVEIKENLPDNLIGDEVRVRQIITNLLNNSVKYTDFGSIKLAVSCDHEGEFLQGETISLVIAVSDTGIGIRPEDIGNLFKKFERMDLKRNITVEGTGLGLAITHSLVESMGGTIDVKSEYGKGSTFTIVIPQQVVSAEPVGDFRVKFEKSIQMSKIKSGMFTAPDARILIVDDTRMNIEVAVGLLSHTKIKIDSVMGGREALELTDSEKYDVILLDQRMPEMDGTETLQKIREQKTAVNLDTPIICLTADAVSGAREKYMSEGFTDYLTKPVDGISLEKILIKYLPEEKVHLKEEGISEDISATDRDENESGEQTDALFDRLKEKGIDISTGLSYCQGQEELYRSILVDYADTAGEKISDMQKFYEAEDWKNYGILVHAVKSTSKMIGAMELSEMAKQLEGAANDGDTDAIRAGHAGMIEEYGSISELILKTEGGGTDSDDEIMEFDPEGEL